MTSLAVIGEQMEAHARRRRALQVAAQRKLAGQSLEAFLSVFTPDFQPGWHITEMCQRAAQLEDAIRKPSEAGALLRRLLVTMPPRHAKSQTYSKGFPLFFSARNPKLEVIVASATGELAEDHGIWCKQTATDPRFKAIFPDYTLNPEVNSRSRLLTAQGGGLRFVGRDGTINGRGAHLFILDDPYASAKEADSETVNTAIWQWFWTTAMQRLAPGGAMVVMHTRWRTNDLIGKIKAQDAERPAKKRRWFSVDFPAIATKDEKHRKKGEALHPARFPQRGFYEELQENMTPRDWLAIYQQQPVAEEGNFFKRKHFHLYDPAKLPPADQLYFYLSTDYALETKEENDYTCLWPMAVTADDHQYFLPDFVHDKLDIYESVIATIDLAERYNVFQILIESGPILSAIRPMLEREMRKRSKYFEIVVPPACGMDKRRKAAAAQAQSGMGLIHLPDTPKVNFTALPEILAFDKGDFDDIVDTISIPARCLQHRVLPTPTGLNFSDEIEGDGGTLRDPHGIYEEDLERAHEFAMAGDGPRIPSLFSDW